MAHSQLTDGYYPWVWTLTADTVKRRYTEVRAMDRPRVLVPHHVSAEMARDLRNEILDRKPDIPVEVTTSAAETEAILDDVEVVLAYSFGREWIERAESLAWIQGLSAGVDSFEYEFLDAAGVRLTSGSGVHAEPIAQQVLCYVFLFERGILADIRRQPDRVWDRHWGEEVSDKTVGIVGVGAIGSRVAERVGTFGATTIGTKRDPTTGGDAVDELYGPDGLSELLDRSDYLVLACPLTEETRGLIGSDELTAIGDDAVVVNVARGGIVDEVALTDALEDGHVRGAALDTFEEEPLPEASPLWGMDEVVVTPHMSGTSQFLNARKANLFVENYDAFRTGGEMRNRVV